MSAEPTGTDRAVVWAAVMLSQTVRIQLHVSEEYSASIRTVVGHTATGSALIMCSKVATTTGLVLRRMCARVQRFVLR